MGVDELSKILEAGPWAICALLSTVIVFLWKKNDSLHNEIKKLLAQCLTTISDTSGTSAKLTMAIEANNRANDTFGDTLKTLVATGEGRDRILSFVLEELRSQRVVPR